VTDNQTRLIWLKNADCFGRENWSAAMASALRLGSGDCGLRDGSVAGQWRLPSKDEWNALIDKKASKPVLPYGHPFTGVQSGSYWSSTTWDDYAGNAWNVYLYDGEVSVAGQNRTYYVWPVRDGR
ncbi:MAG: DUF1566 domain-containing protein, partial [Synechococcaceae cyanobacterium SM1_2_3]|nr:DUF1566 domain-containing protein [Synechococcaceae cyanobacterium SM1_2_3]